MTKTSEKPIASKEAEQALLGCLFLAPKKIGVTAEKILPADFYYPSHQMIYQAMLNLDQQQKPVGYDTVYMVLKEAGKDSQVGGAPYLVSLNEEVRPVTHLEHYAEIVYEKSTLRQLSQISAKAYKSCFNGHKANDLIVKLQEEVANLAAGMGGVRKTNSVANQVRDWVKMAPGKFETRTIYNDLGLRSTSEKKSALMELMKLEQLNIIEKIPGQRGHYRTIEAIADKIDFLHADASNWLDLTLPLDIHKYARIFPTNIVIVAGEKGSGKTAFCLDLARLNKHKYPIRYMSSEMAAEELRCRLEKFELPIEEWLDVDFRVRRDNFADLIDPNGINIIDFLEKYDQFWTIASDIRAIFDKLQKGICIIAIQKDKGAESGRGGMFTREKCRLHIGLTKKNEARIDDVKVFAMEGYNPNGLVLKYKLIQGARFQLSDTETDGRYGRENW